MVNVVHIMNRDEAVSWMSRFISSQPLNCRWKHHLEWINAIIDAVERNRLPICKEALGLVSCIIAMESGFRVDPLAVDPSREHDMSALLTRAEKEFEQKLIEKLEEEMVKEILTLEERIVHLQNTLRERVETSFSELVANAKDKVEVVVSFLAMLELVKQRLIHVEQGELFSEISLRHAEQKVIKRNDEE